MCQAVDSNHPILIMTKDFTIPVEKVKVYSRESHMGLTMDIDLNCAIK
jgi:hypothetical protein